MQSTNTLLILGQKLNPSGGHLRWLGNIKLFLLVKIKIRFVQVIDVCI